MDARQLLRTLRAVRHFAPEPIDRAVLLEILETGRWTGSAKNTQPWEIIVVQDAEVLQRLSRLAPLGAHVGTAPTALALLIDDASHGFDEGRLAQTLMLAAWAEGIGSCIASIFPEANQSSAKKLLGVPSERTLRTVISVGYPADEHARSFRATAQRQGARPMIPLGRKPLADLVSWERYAERHQPGV